ncbi:hypothetical protein GWI33_000557 [Rhynchophorus ferrugineus]|uniref:Caspase-8 n=1 Tax=Rhynchophorus ferrugineus TaxID=354439 RepID=A0A834INZ1_RHYFE|nr:hypothetical protein GWI33_000557 [Rhynchophorus ferrugineus]
MGLKESKNTIHVDELSDTESDSEYFSPDMELCESDAVFTNSILGSGKPLTAEEICRIQNSLDEYEVVSLVYLLFESPNLALRCLQEFFLDSKNPILNNWAMATSEKNWLEMLLEALSIIQNYQVLKNLGLKKAELISKYMPHNSNISIVIKKSRKALYLLAEKLDHTEIQTLLNSIKLNVETFSDMKSKYNKYIELFLLNLELNNIDICKYIKGALKSMDKLELYDMLSECFPNNSSITMVNQNASSSKVSDKLHFTTRDTTYPTPYISEFHQMNSSQLSSGSNSIINDDIYPMDSNNPGILLIINQAEFYTEPDPKYKDLLPEHYNDQQLNARPGTDKDKDKLKMVFEKFGYEVIIKQNLPHYTVLSVICDTAKKIDKESSFIVCILSHGDKGVVYGANSCKIHISLITKAMTVGNSKLKELPKVLILQSCQGTDCQKRESDEDEESFLPNVYRKDGHDSPPKIVNLFIYFATIPGYAAIRDIHHGSWLIQCLCSKIEEMADRCHFSDICTRVNKIISTKEWREKTGTNIMTPLIETTFTKSFYLLPPKK